MSKYIIALENVSKAFGPKVVLEEASFVINKGERVALVGENGCGKSTLAKIIVGLEEKDEGSILTNGLVGYLPQEITLGNKNIWTVRRYLENARSSLDKLRHELETLEYVMLSGSCLEEELFRYGELQEIFESLGGYDLDYKVEQVMQGLGLSDIGQNRILETLSGGEKMRVALAALLLQPLDLLILDEPTNNLDFAMLSWLENYLKNSKNAVLLISHDRKILNNAVNKIIDISHGVQVYHGNYDYYRHQQEKVYQQHLHDYEEYTIEVKELRKVIKSTTHNKGSRKLENSRYDKMGYDQHGANEQKSRSRIISQAKVRLEYLLQNPIARPVKQGMLHIHFQSETLVSTKIFSWKNLAKGYDNTILFKDFFGEVIKGERVVICGANGCGKSSFLEILLGKRAPDKGDVFRVSNGVIAYLSQDNSTLDIDNIVLEEYALACPGCSEGELRADLYKYGLFKENDVKQKIAQLSQGMQQKLKLAKVLAAKPQVLVLDEPTNHLDFNSLESLENALQNFNGTLICVSHDRMFIEKVATRKIDL